MIQRVIGVIRSRLLWMISLGTAIIIIILANAAFPFQAKPDFYRDHTGSVEFQANQVTNSEDTNRQVQNTANNYYQPSPTQPVVVAPQPINIEPPVEEEPPTPRPAPTCGGCGSSQNVKNLQCPMFSQSSNIVCAY